MTNTIAAGLNNAIIREGALQGFVSVLLPILRMATDISPKAAEKGSSVSVGLIGTTTANDFAGDYRTSPDSTVTAVEVSLDKHKYKTVHLTDNEFWNSSAIKLEELGFQAGQAVAKASLVDILGIVTAANYGAAAFTGVASGFDSDDVADIRLVCNQADIPMLNRYMALTSDYTTSLLKDDSINSLAKYGTADAIRNGTLGPISGFATFESDVIPSNSENLVGFCGVGDGLAVAMRYLAPQEGNTYSFAAPMVDDETGLVLGVREWYDNNTGKRYMAFETVYGKSVGNSAGLKRIVSA
jgi:hypothetical protein